MADGTDSGESLSASEIADKLGYRTSAVSNWRKRFADFPRPNSRGRYQAQEVVRWLREHKKLPDGSESDTSFALRVPASSGRKPALEAWPRTESVPDELETPVLLTLITMKGLRITPDGDLDDPHAWLRAAHVREARGSIPDGCLTTVLRRVPVSNDLADLREHAEGLVSRHREGPEGRAAAAEVFREVTSRRRVSEVRRGESSTPPALSSLIAGLLPDRPGSLLDPAAGLGDALVHSVETRGIPRHVTAVELDPITASLCGQNLALNRVPARVLTGDSFTIVPDLGPQDAVVAHPPAGVRLSPDSPAGWILARELGGGSREMEFAWLALAVGSLAPGGTAVVVTTRSGLGWSTGVQPRRRLLERGCVRAVIGLPVEMVRGGDAAIWVLGAATREPGDVLFIDGSGHKETEFVPLAIREYHQFLKDPHGYGPRPGFSGTVPGGQLLSDEFADLDPTARVQLATPMPAEEAADTLRRRGAKLIGAARRVEHLVEQLPTSATTRKVERVVSIERAEQLGLITILRPAGAGGTEDAFDQILTGQSDPTAEFRTEPGDVVLRQSPTVRAVVDDRGGTAIRGPLIVIRPRDGDARVNPYLLAVLLSASPAPQRRSRQTRGISPTLTLPVLDHQSAEAAADAARRVYETSTAAGVLERNARRLREEFAEMVRAGIQPGRRT